MSLPPPLVAVLRDHFGSVPRDVRIVSRGVDVQAARCTIAGQRYLIKLYSGADLANGQVDPVTAEARGLKLLADAGALRLPQVYAQAAAQGDCPAYLLTE